MNVQCVTEIVQNADIARIVKLIFENVKVELCLYDIGSTFTFVRIC